MRRKMLKASLSLVLAAFLSLQPMGATLKSYSYEDIAPTQVQLSYTLSSSAAPKMDRAPVNPEFIEWVNEVENQRYRSSRIPYGVIPSPTQVFTDYSALRPYGAPQTYDLRKTGRLTAIRDQGQNGSCWTFACYGALESYLKPQGTYDFAEKHMRNTHGFDWDYKQGGNRYLSSAYLARWSGPVNESDDPYDDYDPSSPYSLPRQKDTTLIEFIPDVKNGYDTTAINTIKNAIMQDGAVATTICGGTAPAHYDNVNDRANHAVAIVGWDDNYSKKNFGYKTPPTDGAWIIRNSWGKNWGNDGGYFYVSYHDICIAKHNAQYKVKDMGDYDNIWQYDELGMTEAVGNGTSGWMANVFGPTKENVSVNAVGFFVPNNNTKYEVYLVSDAQNGLDQKIKVAQGTVTYAGYTMVDFDKQPIAKGKYFAPVVYLTSSGSYNIAIEQPFNKYSSKARASKGQSFYSADGKNWRDLTSDYTNSNVCLKAFTVNGGNAPAPAEEFGRLEGYTYDTQGNRLSGVKVSVKGTDLSVVSSYNGYFSIDKVPVGNANLIAEKEGYKTVEGTMQVQANRTSNVEVKLEKESTPQPPVEKYGKVYGYIRDEASGRGIANAKVTVEGTDVSVVTSSYGYYSLNKVPEGARKIIVQAEGYEVKSENVNVRDGYSSYLTLKLTKSTNPAPSPDPVNPTPSEEKGSVQGYVRDSQLSTRLSGVKVSVKGTNISTVTSYYGSYNLKDVPTGNQTLVFSKEGYNNVEKNVTVYKDSTATLNVVISPAMTYNSNYGTVSGVVRNSYGYTISGVTVKIEGTNLSAVTDYYGRYTIKDVPTGSQNVVFSKYSYKEFKSSIMVNENGESKLDAVLEYSYSYYRY